MKVLQTRQCWLNKLCLAPKDIAYLTLRAIEFEGADREGLKETPSRMVRAWSEMYQGYDERPEDILSARFEDGACKELVVVRNIEFFSTCEHHFLPFYGNVSIGYLPSDAVVGLSKLARLVDCYARRLQIQEKMTAQVADAIMEHLKAQGAMVVVTAQHLCMMARGVKKREAEMVTSAVRGAFTNDNALRAEFMGLIK